LREAKNTERADVYGCIAVDQVITQTQQIRGNGIGFFKGSLLGQDRTIVCQHWIACDGLIIQNGCMIQANMLGKGPVVHKWHCAMFQVESRHLVADVLVASSGATSTSLQL
jgi:hypothetical protein